MKRIEEEKLLANEMRKIENKSSMSEFKKEDTW